MAVEKIDRITICALTKYRKKLLETIQRQELIEVQFSKCEDLKHLDTFKSRNIFEKHVNSSLHALDILKSYIENFSEHPSSFTGKKIISSKEYYTKVKNTDKTLRDITDIIVLDKNIIDAKNNIAKLELQLDMLKPWEGLDVSMRLTKTKRTVIFTGSLPYEINESNLLKKFIEKNPELDNIYVEIISSSKEMTCVFLVCEQVYSQKVNDILRGIGFTPPPLKSKENPKERKKMLQKRIKDLKSQISTFTEKLKNYKSRVDDIRFVADYYQMRCDKYKALEKLSLTRKTFILTGYVPANKSAKLKDFLEKNFCAIVELETPKDDEDVPVILKNNPLSEPAEAVLEGYSLPGKGEVDPTSVMSIFYYILYGIMLSDAGYGLVMSLGCGIALMKFKNMAQSVKNMIKLLFFCGISTIFWGIMFGSFFGDSINVIAKTFFGLPYDIVGPVWISMDKQPMTMLAFAFGVGVVHLLAGLFVALYQDIKCKKIMDAICDVFFWILILLGGTIYIISVPMAKDLLTLQDLMLPTIVVEVAKYAILVGLVGVLLTAGRNSKGILKKFLKGLYGLYGIIGYVGDILSYSRLLALGLATGLIASVFNQLASSMGGSVIGVIFFIAVFLVGHTINIGINALGSYVHCNRLQFVEFFGKFYEGGGRKFAPFSNNTKYYSIKEDIDYD